MNYSTFHSTLRHILPLTLLRAMLALLVLSSCENPVIEYAETDENTDGNSQSGSPSAGGNSNAARQGVTISVREASVAPWVTRSSTSLTEACSRLNFVVYRDGKKAASLAQERSDAGSAYGSATFTLEPTDYKLLVVAHSSNGGNPTLSNLEDIHFTNSLGYTDTFYFYGDLSVTAEDATHEISLTRATTLAVLRFADGAMPLEAKSCTATYTGGSGRLNVTTGHGGNVNSRQEATFAVTGGSPLPDLHLFTFLQADEGTLNINVKFFSTSGSLLQERTFSDVPVAHGKLTVVEGYFFDYQSSFILSGNTEWEEYAHIYF